RGAVVASGSASCRSRSSGGSTPAIGESLGGATEGGRDTGFEKGWARGRARPLTPRRSAAHGGWLETRTAGAGLRNQFVDFVARGPLDRAGMRSEVSPFASLANSAAIGMELPASSGACAGARRREDPAMEAATLAGN